MNHPALAAEVNYLKRVFTAVAKSQRFLPLTAGLKACAQNRAVHESAEGYFFFLFFELIISSPASFLLEWHYGEHQTKAVYPPPGFPRR
jgi:hypothetical protein